LGYRSSAWLDAAVAKVTAAVGTTTVMRRRITTTTTVEAVAVATEIDEDEADPLDDKDLGQEPHPS
jgi:hypothetical protein